jgi:protease IV
MAKFFIGLVTGVAIVFLTFILLFFAALRFREKPPQIAANSVLVLRLNGEIPEKPPLELPDFLSEKTTPTVSAIWQNLKKAAADSNITALVLAPEGVSAGWATLEEIRSDVEQFKKSGKPVYAYLHTPSAREYYLALGADRIFLGPSDPLMLKGMRAEIMYFKKTLDKLGVNVEVEHAGKYKDFGDMFTRSDMSPETREVISSVVDGLYGNLVNRIAAARKKSPDDVRAIIDQGPFTATQALKADLVDELRFEDQLWGELKDRLKSGEPAKVAFEKYAKTEPVTGKSTIALVIGSGDIVRGDPTDNGSDERSLTSYGFNKILKRVGNDSSVKGVIVRIDPPGGEVTASDDIWREMNLLGKKKPVVISMSDVAASGGYYMAMTGDPIIAYPETETGSIGVVFGKPNLHGLYDKLGVTKDAVERGRHAGIDSDYTPLTADERDKLREGIEESYHDFVTKVATARRRSYQDIDAVAQGRVWLGSQAKDHGLVDELGGLDTALAAVKKKANIPASESVTLTMYPGRRSLLDMLLHRSTPEDMLETRVAQLIGPMPVRAWLHGGMLSIVPFRIAVR